MKNILLLFLTVLALASCHYEQVDFVRMQGLKLDKIDDNEVFLHVDFEMHNPNKYGITMKPSDVDIYLEDVYFGKGYLLEKVKFPKRSTATYSAPIKIALEKGKLLQLVALGMRERIKVRVTGKVKGAVGIFGKKIRVDETRELSGANLKLGSLFK